jgi:hypothetical protein
VDGLGFSLLGFPASDSGWRRAGMISSCGRRCMVLAGAGGGTLVRMVGPDSPLLSWYGFPIAFLLTCAIEVPAYLAAFWLLGWCRSRPSSYRPLTIRSALTLAFLLNLISHPLLWMVALRYDRTGQLIVAETRVALVEGMLIFAVVSRRPGTESRLSRLGWSLLTAIGVNTLSLLIGLIMMPAMINR